MAFPLEEGKSILTIDGARGKRNYINGPYWHGLYLDAVTASIMNCLQDDPSDCSDWFLFLYLLLMEPLWIHVPQ